MSVSSYENSHIAQKRIREVVKLIPQYPVHPIQRKSEILTECKIMYFNTISKENSFWEMFFRKFTCVSKKKRSVSTFSSGVADLSSGSLEKHFQISPMNEVLCGLIFG